MKSLLAGIVLIGAFANIAAAQHRDDETQLQWQAGVASAVITPESPLPMAGYAARKDWAEGTEQDLFAKALVVEDSDGQRGVIVTLDLIGVLAELREDVVKRAASQYGLAPEAVVLNASHTHCGPSYGDDEAREYFEQLKETLVELIGTAIDDLEPATLTYSQARCGFAMNRRTPTPTGFKNHPNPDGPVDHAVPVLSAVDAQGQRKAVLFGYACHNTTMGFLKWLGDYAGYAQEYCEADHPGVVAMFMNGCGADQNPYPRRELDYAKKHGRALATAVEAALEEGQRVTHHQERIAGPLRAGLETVDLEFATDRPDFAYPVQILRFGDELALIALGSEVTVDYSLRLKHELGSEDGPAIWVAGYSNVYDGYIPSRRVLLEGGYEAQSRPWQPTLEERIVGKVHEVYRATQE